MRTGKMRLKPLACLFVFVRAACVGATELPPDSTSFRRVAAVTFSPGECSHTARRYARDRRDRGDVAKEINAKTAHCA
jgi:hypothetical protein